MEYNKYSPIVYKYTRASKDTLKRLERGLHKPNPIKRSGRLLPLDKMLVGDALFISSEVNDMYSFWRIKNSMVKFNQKFDNMFVVIEHKKPIYAVEIVRIK